MSAPSASRFTVAALLAVAAVAATSRSVTAQARGGTENDRIESVRLTEVGVEK